MPTWSARGGEQKAKCDQSVVCVARNHQSCRRIAQLAQPLCPSLSAAKEREEVVSRHTGAKDSVTNTPCSNHLFIAKAEGRLGQDGGDILA